MYVHNLNTGCYYTQEFYVLGNDNFITPNDDGLNDTWLITDLDYFGGKNATFQVYDRYGKLLYEQSSNTIISWDGKYEGRTLPTAAYWYIFTLPDGRQIKSWIFIKNRED